MRHPFEPRHEGQATPETVLTLWIPRGLWSSMRTTAAQVNMAPPLFLRKAVVLHQIHRLDDPKPAIKYRDQELLQAAYKDMQSKEKEGLRQMYNLQLEVYLREYDEAMRGEAQGRSLEYYNVTTEDVALPQEAADYIDEHVFSMDPAKLCLNAQTFCIAATLELIYLYRELETISGNS